MTSVAVIVTTYNRPDALAAVLAGYRAQSDREFEMIVADDGSTAETAAVIDEAGNGADFNIIHVRHEDQGFRAAAIRNRAIAQTAAEYIIFSDGDCIPLPGFVERHRRMAEKGWFLSGNRILLSEAFSQRVLRDRLPVHAWGSGRWLKAKLSGEVNRWLPLLTLPPDLALRKWPATRWEGVMTCNLSVWRKDLLEVDGLDEAYSGWGLEDSDLAIRLLRAGVRHKSARFSAPVLHLWHGENDRGSLAENRRRLDDVLMSDRIRAVNGLSQYLENERLNEHNEVTNS
jgi:glycosyltransferase involved in cell wall biosynthesis